MINELIQQLEQKVGLSTDQAHSTLHTIRQYVVEKFPMLAGAVDNIFPATGTTPATGTAPAAPTTPVAPTMHTAPTTTNPDVATATAAPHQEEGFLDKISDYIPGKAGQSIEDFAKKAAHGAENLFHKK